MESVSSNARKATETEVVFKRSNVQEADLKLNDGLSTGEPMSTVMDEKNGPPRSRRHSSAPEKRVDSLWTCIHIILSYIYMKTLLRINVRNRFAGLSFPVFKTTKLSDASSQTDPPPIRETRVVFSQTVAWAHANAASQTATSATETVAVQTVTPANHTAAAQTDATHSHVAAVQTDETSRTATSVQTDAQTNNVVASQTDAQTSTTVAAVQTDSTTVYDTVAVPARTNCPNDVRLVYNTFSQTGPTAFSETVAAQTDPAAFSETVAAQTDPAAFSETVAAQTDWAAFSETVAAQTDWATFCETVAVQTNHPTGTMTYNTFSQTALPSVCKTVACQTDSPPSAGETIAVRTDSTPREDGGDDEKRSSAAVQDAALTTDADDEKRSSVAVQDADLTTDDDNEKRSSAAVQDADFTTDGDDEKRSSTAVQDADLTTDGDDEKRSSVAVQDADLTTDSDDEKRSSASVQESDLTTDDDDEKQSSAAVQEADLTTDGAGVAANRTGPLDAATVSIGVQTDEPACETVQNLRKDSSGDAIDELLAKFGRGDRKTRVVNKNRVNLKAVLKKIELNGFKSLSFQEMSFTHQKIIDNSMALCNKYKSLIEIAVKHLPSWQRGSIKQKHDIIHVFATLDKVLDLKNNELDAYKVDLSLEIKRRIAAEEQYDIKMILLSKMKVNYEQLVTENKTLLESCHSKTDQNSHTDKFVQQCSNSRFTYDDIMAGKFLKRPENKN